MKSYTLRTDTVTHTELQFILYSFRYIKGLGISEENEAAVRLKNWKDPNKAGARGKVHATGDFSVILEEICGGRCGTSASAMTIGQVSHGEWHHKYSV